MQYTIFTGAPRLGGTERFVKLGWSQEGILHNNTCYAALSSWFDAWGTPIWRLPKWFFYLATHESGFVRGTPYKIPLCRILAWWGSVKYHPLQTFTLWRDYFCLEKVLLPGEPNLPNTPKSGPISNQIIISSLHLTTKSLILLASLQTKLFFRLFILLYCHLQHHNDTIIKTHVGRLL